MAYSTALRHSMLLNGGTVGLIEVYQSRAPSGLSAFSLSVGSCRTRLWAAGWTPTAVTATSRSPLMIRLSMSSALTLRATSMRSGSALRLGAVGGSHWPLGARLKLLPGCRSANLYGPVETTELRYLAPVSLS